MDNYNIMFESDNLYYVQMSEELIDDYLKMYCDEEIQKTLFKKTFSTEQIENWVKINLAKKKDNAFSVIEKKTNDYVGEIEIITNKNIGEVIISITPAKQNNHYGTEAISAAVNYGYEKMGLAGFELYVYKNNLRAIHCYQRVGFIADGDGITEKDIHMSHKK